jgi:ribose transport system permease protein
MTTPGGSVSSSAPALASRREDRRPILALLDERLNLIGLAVTIGFLIAFFALKSPHFLTTSNFAVIGTAISITGIMAAFSTIVLISGGLDLSIGAVAALGGLVSTQVVVSGASLAVAILAGLGAGLGAGLVNSLLIVGFGVNALIATIGTQFMLRGTDYLFVNGQPVDAFGRKSFLYVGNGTPLGVPTPIYLLLASFVAVAALLHFTRFGSRVYAVGGNEQAARLAGIRVGLLRVLIYGLSGMSAALAGIVLASLNQSAFPDVGAGDELQVIAAVILGGTALMGGRGSAVGTFLGVSMLGVLANGLNILSVRAFWQIFVSGAALVIAVSFDAVRSRARGPVG